MHEVLTAPVEEFAEEHEDINMFLADLLASGKDMSFQDLRSIGRAFTRYFDVTVERDVMVNDIILAQGSRHAIVHASGVVDRKLLAQLRNAKPRNIKPNLQLGDRLLFTPEEIDATASAMRNYLDRLNAGINKHAV